MSKFADKSIDACSILVNVTECRAEVNHLSVGWDVDFLLGKQLSLTTCIPGKLSLNEMKTKVSKF